MESPDASRRQYRRPWLAALLLLLVAFLACPPAAGAECGLDDAVPEESRIYLNEGGVDMPFGIYEHEWDSALLVGKIAKILVEEVLGYHARYSGGGDSSNNGLYAVAGCKDPKNITTNPGCGGDAVTFIHHATLEVWGLHKVSAMERRLAEWPHIIPESAGRMGYEGSEGIFVYRHQQDAAYSDSGLALEYYKSFNVSWHAPWKYYDGIDAIDHSRLMKCEKSYMMGTIEVSDYLKFTGDDAGVEMTDLGPVAKCWYGSFWLSPACRDAPETCVITMDGGSGWFVNDIMQWATFHNMPIAYAIGATFSDYATIGQTHNVIPYWWRPDTTFIELAPVPIQFPEFNEEERLRGLLQSGSGKIPLTKWMYPNLVNTASRIREFLLRLTMTVEDIDGMLLDMKVHKTNHSETACAWLKRKRALWQRWTPIKTACVTGQGLASRAGEFVGNRSDADGCLWCPDGMLSVPYTDDVGLSHVCKRCPPGTSQAVPGQTECINCEPGRYSDVNASVECKRCEVGAFQDLTGGTSCAACPAPTTTLFLAARSPSGCICPQGTYRRSGSATTCWPCPEAMVCLRPNSSEAAIPLLGQASAYPFPEVAEGFMTLDSAPLSPYRCKPASLCPGGRVGSCAANRDPAAVSCGRCLPGHFLDSDGVCSRCESGKGVVLLAVAFVTAVIVLVLLTVAINQNSLQQQKSTASCVIIMGLTFSGLQSMGTFKNLSVVWMEPFKTIFHALSLVSFNIDGLEVECMLGGDPVVKYVLRQLVAPFAVPIIACIILAKKRLLTPSLQFWVELCNTIGAFYQVFFTSIIVSCTVPFVCYAHPGSNGFSMLSAPEVLCYVEGRHTALMMVGVTAFLVIVCPFVGVVGYATLKYKHFVSDNIANDGTGLRMFRFLFFRFRFTAYFYGTPMLVRSLLVCLVPIVFRDDGAAQIMMACVIFVVFLIAQASIWPWRFTSANIADSILVGIMLLMLVCAAMATEFEEMQTTLVTLGVMLVLAFLVSIVALLGHGLYARFFSSKRFDMFMCHHKHHAAAQARFVQLSLWAKSGQTTFIDSDHLTDLNELFDIVRCRIGRMVVFLTSETLRRPWCAGEITITFMNHQRMILVKTARFLAPTPQQLEEVGSYVDCSEHGTNLTEYGVTMPCVRRAYTWILSGQVPSIGLDASLPGRAQFSKLVSCLIDIRQAQGSRQSIVAGSMGSMALEEKQFKRGSIIVSSDPSDEEATAGAGILIYKLQVHVLGMTGAGVGMLADAGYLDDDAVQEAVLNAHAVVVLLTSGSLECVQQMQVIMVAMAVAMGPTQHGDKLGIVPVSTPGFQFPRQDYYSQRLPSLFPLAQPTVPVAIQAFFKRISVLLATNASEKVITAQAMDVLARIPLAGAGIRDAVSILPAIPALCDICGSRPASDLSLSSHLRHSCNLTDDCESEISSLN